SRRWQSSCCKVGWRLGRTERVRGWRIILKTMKILLIEDHPDSRRSLCRLIERPGHEVVACATVEEAEAEIEKERCPFFILDWMLPGKSGVVVCRVLRARPS